MTDILLYFILGALPILIIYTLLVRPLQKRIDILNKLLDIAVAQREAALSGKDRAAIERVYREGLAHFGLKDPAKGADDVLSGHYPGPQMGEW